MNLRIAEAQPLFCKERYIVSGGSADCLCLYIFYVLTDRKKKAACLLRVFAKGRRNNGMAKNLFQLNRYQYCFLCLLFAAAMMLRRQKVFLFHIERFPSVG